MQRLPTSTNTTYMFEPKKPLTKTPEAVASQNNKKYKKINLRAQRLDRISKFQGRMIIVFKLEIRSCTFSTTEKPDASSCFQKHVMEVDVYHMMCNLRWLQMIISHQLGKLWNNRKFLSPVNAGMFCLRRNIWWSWVCSAIWWCGPTLSMEHTSYHNCNLKARHWTRTSHLDVSMNEKGT